MKFVYIVLKSVWETFFLFQKECCISEDGQLLKTFVTQGDMFLYYIA